MAINNVSTVSQQMSQIQEATRVRETPKQEIKRNKESNNQQVQRIEEKAQARTTELSKETSAITKARIDEKKITDTNNARNTAEMKDKETMYLERKKNQAMVEVKKEPTKGRNVDLFV